MAVKNKQKIPKLRFPEFSGEWENFALNELLEESKNKNEDLRFVKEDVLSVSGDYGIVNQIEFQGRSFAGAHVLNYGIVETNDIVYTKSPLKSNPYGIIKVNKGKSGIVSTLYAIYKPKNTIEPYFLDYYFSLKSRTNNYLRPLVNKGAKNDMKVKNNEVLKGRIYVPGLVEQQKIADFLIVVDERIEKLERKVELLEQYKKGIMQSIFSQQIRFKTDDGNDYPDWGEKKLNQLAIVNPSNGELPSEFVYIDLDSVSNGVMIKERRIKASNAPSRAQRVIKKNDILFQTVRPYQKNNFHFKSDLDNHVASTGYAQFRANEASEFMYQYIQTSEFVKKVLNRCTGTSYPAINSDDLANISGFVPTSTAEQKKIADFLTAIDDKIELNNKELQQAKQFKRGLLQQMFV